MRGRTADAGTCSRESREKFFRRLSPGKGRQGSALGAQPVRERITARESLPKSGSTAMVQGIEGVIRLPKPGKFRATPVQTVGHCPAPPYPQGG